MFSMGASNPLPCGSAGPGTEPSAILPLHLIGTSGMASAPGRPPHGYSTPQKQEHGAGETGVQGRGPHGAAPALPTILS